MIRIQHILMFPMLMTLVGCSVNTVRGSGHLSTESRNVSNFQRVTLKGSGELTIEQTGKEALTITADDNLLPLITSDVDGNELVLEPKKHTNIDPTQRIAYKLEVGKLVGISVAGDGVLNANGIVSDRLQITGAGSTTGKLSGQVENLEIVVTGEGKYEAGDLKSKEVKVMITGDGKAVVAASEKLDVTVIGSGTVEYIGDPTIKQSVVGSGSVQKRAAGL
jgi:hypothetical protein